MNELIYGRNACIEIIKNDRTNSKSHEIVRILIAKRNEDIIELLNKKHLIYEIVTKEHLDELVASNSQGVVIEVLDYKYSTINDIINIKSDSLIVILDGLEDPHNLGAIIRSAEISGCDGIIIPKNRSVSVNSTVAKISCGALENIKIVQVTNLTQTLKSLKKEGYWIVGAEALPESKNFWDMDFKMKICLIIGSEGKGISRLVREECDFLVQIPMWGKINSLNASVSAAILIYEIRRQQYK